MNLPKLKSHLLKKYTCLAVKFITNELDNAQIENYEAQTQNVKINTLLSIRALFDNETLMTLICDELDINYEDIKDKIPTETVDLDAESEILAKQALEAGNNGAVGGGQEVTPE